MKVTTHFSAYNRPTDVIIHQGVATMAMTQSQRVQKWKTKAVRRYEFYVHKEKEKEIYDFLEPMENRRQYVLDLIKEDMKKRDSD